MNPHSKGGHAAAGTHALGLPAPSPPPFPRRTIVADYCRTCGRTSGCWQGCAGGERVAPENLHLPAETGRLAPTKHETPLVILEEANGVSRALGGAL